MPKLVYNDLIIIIVGLLDIFFQNNQLIVNYKFRTMITFVYDKKLLKHQLKIQNMIN